jgi:hypothetical protein
VQLTTAATALGVAQVVLLVLTGLQLLVFTPRATRARRDGRPLSPSVRRAYLLYSALWLTVVVVTLILLVRS